MAGLGYIAAGAALVVNSCGGCANSTQDKTVSACIGSANERGWSSVEAVGCAGAWQAASKAGPAVTGMAHGT